MLDVEILSNTIYSHAKYMHLLTGKQGEEVLDTFY